MSFDQKFFFGAFGASENSAPPEGGVWGGLDPPTQPLKQSRGRRLRRERVQGKGHGQAAGGPQAPPAADGSTPPASCPWTAGAHDSRRVPSPGAAPGAARAPPPPPPVQSTGLRRGIGCGAAARHETPRRTHMTAGDAGGGGGACAGHWARLPEPRRRERHRRPPGPPGGPEASLGAARAVLRGPCTAPGPRDFVPCPPPPPLCSRGEGGGACTVAGPRVVCAGAGVTAWHTDDGVVVVVWGGEGAWHEPRGALGAVSAAVHCTRGRGGGVC